MISDLNLLCFHEYICVLDPILQVIVTYYVLWSGNPGVTTTWPTLGDGRSLRSSSIHYVLMLCSGTLLKGGLNIPYFPLGPRCHGRVGQKMSCKSFSISTYDYVWNTCLHYIDELELVLCHPRLWLLHDECHPTQLSLPIHCLWAFHMLIFAKFRCYCCYNHYKTATITFATVTVTSILLCY